MSATGTMFACPAAKCGGVICQVVDSRMQRDGRTRTRRRVCARCGLRFTTREQVLDASGRGVVRKGGGM